MAVRQQVRILLLAALVLTTAQLSKQTCPDDDLYVIRSAAPNGLVVDATDPEQITLQHYTGFRPQLWRLQRTHSANLVYIINYYTGQSLDFVDRDDRLHLVTSDRKNALRQQWNLGLKGRITNAENGKNVDVMGSNFTVGSELILWLENNDLAQSFVFHKKL